MREALTDLVKNTAPLFKAIILNGEIKSTTVAAMSDDKSIILHARLKEAIPDLAFGEVALSNLGMLNGLLNFPSYAVPGASLNVVQGKNQTRSYVEAFEFKDAKGVGSIYRLTDPKMISESARPPKEISQITWDVEIEPNRSNVDEFSKLAALFGEVDKNRFSPKTMDGNLVFLIGDDNSSSHRTSVVFSEGVQGTVKGGVKYAIGSFQALLKIAGSYPTRLHITSRGLMMVAVETPFCHYDYFLRPQL